ncbi:Integrase [Vibrio sp. B1FLJ16]|uniref:integrase domain-containing protein n=1 Tax=Vibrio sp. B1FLJ16 TaxID=2751178 RepID=UPI0015F3AE0C|nr:integrase domain-containing protein [Vibrio sp. B1FLJ16]CAD7819544.1 Integrase [Vibrio sp. B1FLJ16]CAE6939340.1 Integrase [Vibrio sp. B1FLJ16]
MSKKNYVGHLIHTPRDFTKPNFNLGSRDMVKALINASFENQGGIVTNTHRARLPALKLFIDFIKTNKSIKRLNDIEKQHVWYFGEFLKNSADKELLSHVTARDYLSHVNRALAQARGDEACVVKATRDLDFLPKSGIATIDEAMKEAIHSKALTQVNPEVGFVMQLQRAFGFRFREASLFDATRALEELNKGLQPMLVRGTKGGQPRALPEITEAKHQLLVQVATYQQSHQQHSLIPVHQSLKAFQSDAWRQTKAADDAYRSHGERKHFACQYYFELVGVRCPVQASIAHGKAHYQYIATTLNISEPEARQRDREARLRLSELLGHHRMGITNAYLG